MREALKQVMKLHRFCNKREWILILLIIVALLRIPTLTTPNFYGDEEIYFVMGRAWNTGVPLYEAMFDHKPPLIYIVAGIFSTVALFRGFLMLSMLVHTYLFWLLAQKFWGEKHPYLAKLSSLVFVVLSTLPTLEGHIVNAELLMMLPVTASLLMIWGKDTADRKEGLPHKYLLAGLVAGIGWLYKVPVMFDVLAIMLYAFVFTKNTLWESIKSVFSLKFWLYGIGFALPLLLTFAYYYLKGHGESYLATVFTVNLGYVSSWKSESFTTFNPFKSGLVVRGFILGVYTLVLYLMRKKLDRRLLFAALWGGFSLFGALLSYRPYPHYLQEIVPAVSLLIPTLFTTANLWGWTFWAFMIAISILTQKDVAFWGYESKPLYANYWQLITGKITKEEYRNRFDNARRNYAIADYIKPRLGIGEPIYVWGSDPTIYNLTNTVPSGGKYIVSFHVRDLKKYDYVMQNLESTKPKAIITLDRKLDFPQLETLIATHYIDVFYYDDAIIYWRLD
ncbi:MAG: hypothetical protein E6P95_00890 [Candidatus Moraniibacteriota bacterium]|nr:MAG: hypothetical protein E6P95_00890 [Candidatus Moranbacteria bacterium]